MRDHLDGLWNDEDFADWYPRDGRPSLAPAQLATVCVLQFLLGLSDRQATEAVRCRIDFKYALALELDDPGVNAPRNAPTPPMSWPQCATSLGWNWSPRRSVPRWRRWHARPGICAGRPGRRGLGAPLRPPGPSGQEPHSAQDQDPRRRRRRPQAVGASPPARIGLPSRPSGRGPAADRRAELQLRCGGPLALAHRRRRRPAALLLGDRLPLRHHGTLRPARAHHQLEGVRRPISPRRAPPTAST
ncbi:transposase [Embleya sp. NPDC059267]|uniref:transposase n=1 Tax=unclassified Embleya TaxID=2699296 RepID=UPI00368C068F